MMDEPSKAMPDWLNAETCIENAEIAYEDSICDEDGPVDTVISSGDLGVVIGLAKHALAMQQASQANGDEVVAKLEVVRQFLLDEYNEPAAQVDGHFLESRARKAWDALHDALAAIPKETGNEG